MAKKSKPKPAQKPDSLSDKIDRELAGAALRKRRDGEKPTREELRALNRVEKAQDAVARWYHYENVPKKDYLEMAGDGDKPRPANVVNDQADRYGFPLRGATLNLRKVLRAFHDFLAANRWKLAELDGQPNVVKGYSEWQEKSHRERALLAEMQRKVLMRQLLPLDEVHDAHGRWSAIIRDVGEDLLKQFGPDAHQLLQDGLKDAERELDRIYQNGQTLKSETEDPPPDNPGPVPPGRADRRGKARPKKRKKP